MLKPTVKTDDDSIKKYEELLSKVQKEDADNKFFINMLKSTISDLKVKQSGREASLKYLKK